MIIILLWLLLVIGFAAMSIRRMKQDKLLASILFLGLTIVAFLSLSSILVSFPKVCPSCGHTSNTSFCTNCGACLEEKAPCLNCGSEIDRDELYCGDCGVKTYSDSQEDNPSISTNKPTGENK